MVEQLFALLMSDVGRVYKVADEALRASLGKDYDEYFISNKYSQTRERILDIIREMELGARVNWDDLNRIEK